MDTLTAARAQMEISLGFHMIFAAMGIGMPVLLLAAEWLYLRTGEAHYRELARRQTKVTALLFAIGAVSGTALSFELGLLWPGLMGMAGSVLGPTFALEGYAFFIEAVFIGLYLYGEGRMKPWHHWLAGVPVAVSGAASGILVVAANAWMQCPPPDTGTMLHGRFVTVDPSAAFRSPAWIPMAVHSTLACYIAVGFAITAVSAWAILKGRDRAYHRAAITLAMVMATASALLQPVSGDVLARMVARTQPVKLAAMEAHFETRRGADILVGGIVDAEHETVRGALRIPNGLSLLVAHDPDAEVRGLRETPRELRPPVGLVHTAFDVMVGAGTALMVVGAAFWLLRWRRRKRGDAGDPPWMLKALVACGPLGFLALEAGWVVTEAGRQPWTVQGLLFTRDAVTPAQGVGVTFVVFTALYLALGAVVVALLGYLARAPEGDGGHAP